MKLKQLSFSLTAGILGGILAFVFSQWIFTTKENRVDIFQMDQADVSKNHVNTYQTSGFIQNQSGHIDFSQAAQSSLAAVVHITTRYNQPNYTLYDFIFGGNPSASRQVESSGSGVIISSDGYIVTNNHVIERSEGIQVVLNDKRSYEAKLIGSDPQTDIALLKIDDKNLPCINYGDSDKLQVGEWVLAVGNPFNLTSTITAGIVSAKARNINILSGQYGIESFIQTDAAVNPGNSGGALVNTNGQLIGINTAIASRTGSYVGYSFAIPVNIVRKIVADLIEFGEVQRAYLGISMADIDSQLAETFDLDNLNGVYVAEISKDGAADKAGIKKGDIILSIEGQETNSLSALLEQLSMYRPGDDIQLIVRRDKSNKNFKLKLHNKYGNENIVKSQKIESLGAEFEALSQQEKLYYRLKNGVKVKTLYPGKMLSQGVREGFIITAINRLPVNSTEDIHKIIKDANENAIFIEGIYPDGSIAYYAFGLD
jgi:serine protease Do